MPPPRELGQKWREAEPTAGTRTEMARRDDSWRALWIGWLVRAWEMNRISQLDKYWSNRKYRLCNASEIASLSNIRTAGRVENKTMLHHPMNHVVHDLQAVTFHSVTCGERRQSAKNVLRFRGKAPSLWMLPQLIEIGEKCFLAREDTSVWGKMPMVSCENLVIGLAA